MADIEEFFKKNVELKKLPRGYNSFTAPHNNYSYQVDLFFISKKDWKVKQKFRGGLVMIDVLSKFAVVVPVRRKVTKSVVDGTKTALEKMGKKPKIIYTDDEKAIASGEFQEYVEEEGIELYRTRGHPAFAERFIRTFKDMLFKRIEKDNQIISDCYWPELLSDNIRMFCMFGSNQFIFRNQEFDRRDLIEDFVINYVKQLIGTHKDYCDIDSINDWCERFCMAHIYP